MMGASMLDRKQRLSIELLPEEESLVRRARASAALKGITLRQWVLDALRIKLAEERRPDPNDAER
jgi:hypothetical protein